MPSCKVCGEEPAFPCPRCHKVWYCDGVHQRVDLTKHQDICFPGFPVQIGERRDHLAIRDIQAGERLFVEKTFLIGPGREEMFIDPEYAFIYICIGCYQKLDQSTLGKCSTCGMPMCKVKEVDGKRKEPLKKCEDERFHQRYECKLMSDLKINLFEKITSSMVYQYITIIRLMMFKKARTDFWPFFENQYNWVPAGLPEDKLKRAKRTAANIRKLFKGNEEKCGLPLDKISEFIEFIFRFGYSSEGSKMLCTALYTRAFLFTHSCAPNTGAFHRCTSLDAGVALESIALQDIRQNTLLTQAANFKLVMLGTDIRQHCLQTNFTFKCACDRCKDPTEFGSYWSAEKCFRVSCRGNLLPKWEPDLTIEGMSWNCTNCHCDAKKFLAIGTVSESEIQQTSTSPGMGEISGLEQTIKCMEDQLHEGHHRVFKGRSVLISECCFVLSKLEESKKPELATKIIALCGLQFGILNHILPGLSPERGRLLFYFVQALRCFTTEDFIPYPPSSRGEGIIDIQERAKKEAIRIFECFPDGLGYAQERYSTQEMIRILSEPDYFLPKYLFDGTYDK